MFHTDTQKWQMKRFSLISHETFWGQECVLIFALSVLWVSLIISDTQIHFYIHQPLWQIIHKLSSAGSLNKSFPLLYPTPIFCSELGGLLKYVRPFLNSISKAKAARLVRSLLDLFLDMEAATGQEVELCLECIEWAKAEKRTFLRQALEVRPCSRQRTWLKLLDICPF